MNALSELRISLHNRGFIEAAQALSVPDWQAKEALESWRIYDERMNRQAAVVPLAGKARKRKVAA